uniref:Forkhead box protein N4 n=1 Tax=Anthurium amnicola TaxID=1678845 RepID=A0A1D1ZIT6_9ARAE
MDTVAEMEEDMEDAFGGGGGAAGDFLSLELDLDYEFDAPRAFDFCRPESPSDARDAELWFDSAGSYPPSPLISKRDMGANIFVDNVNILPKFNDAAEISHVVSYSDIGYSKELPMTEETNRGVNIDTEMSNDFLKVDVKSLVKLPVSSGSTLMRPTASQLAKQNHPRNIKSSSRILCRFQRKSNPNSEKSFTGALDNISQASKRQKLEGGRARKVHDLKEQMPLMHKIPQKVISLSNKQKEEHSVHHPWLRKMKLTIPREPELGTAQRAQRIRARRRKDGEVNAASNTNMFKARPLNRKILEAPSLPIPRKSTPRLPEFQEFRLKTSERAIQHASASSSSQVQNHMACSHMQDVAKDNKGLQPQSDDAPYSQRLHLNDDQHQEQFKKDLHKFKALPLNKKILSGKGDIGVFRSNKREITKPVGFNFKTDKRCQQNVPIELFNKLSLTSEGQHCSTSDTKMSYPIHGSKENIAEHRQHDNKVHDSKVEQQIARRSQHKCEQNVVATSFRPQLNLCRSMDIR